MLKKRESDSPQGLYDPSFEHDACGVGFIAEISGEQNHEIILDGIMMLKNMVHRGAVGADAKTGDGAGLLTQIPHKFFGRIAEDLGFTLPQKGEYGTGMLFLPLDDKKREKIYSMIRSIIKDEKATLLGIRDVPTDPAALGEMAKESMPHIAQIFVCFEGLNPEEIERKLYILRKCIEHKIATEGHTLYDFYIPSLSSKTIVYKGLFVAHQLEHFYPDLTDNDFVSAFCLVHQRYSTNTFPSWSLAQPFRMSAHNGEINTLRGNINRIKARESTLNSALFGEEIKKLCPIINEKLSDSGIFDNAFELLSKGGRSVEHSLMMMIPEAFGTKYHISQDKRAFYEYHAAIMEPWDGPAALAFTDGDKIGATLDRNGLRPARYIITKSGRVVLASETGVLEIPPEDVLHNDRLAPGKMIVVDTIKQRVIYDNEIKASISRQKPYRHWLDENRLELRGLFQVPGPVEVNKAELSKRQRAFGYTTEDIKMVITPMAVNAQEPVGSMGNDASLAVLSDQPLLLYSYFKQLFAQVTNPPIDPYRENLVMSLMSFIGREHNLLDEGPEHCHQLKLPHPILSNDDMTRLLAMDIEHHSTALLPMFITNCGNDCNLESSLLHLCREAELRVDEGFNFLILSDKSVDEENVPIPALLAVAAVHHHLIKVGKRQLVGLVVETGEAREVMHFAMLIGYGASAINPYMVFETIADLKDQGKIPADLSVVRATEQFITAVKKGLLKIMSKMGVSTIRSYRGAQIFEALGLNRAVIDRFFPGTISRIGGKGLEELTEDILKRHTLAFESPANGSLSSGGQIHYRKFSEKHLMTPESVVFLQQAVRTGDYSSYKKYAEEINNSLKNLCTLRGLLKFKDPAAYGRTPIPLAEVEPVESIVKRFVSSAMSLGSISKEAHETIAIAMNRLKAMSNSGEGGEDDSRYAPLPGGDSASSAVKQVASGRFGVTSNYLVNARELQIKMAQGAKPGEGGQLPGHKVNDFIAKVRNSTPGVMLISPPPHHDIYSIEDLAQLIYDLRHANPKARISVKLVSELGVGTVAAGVAKGRADMVLISGHDGGTGASPLSSIKHTGIPWEIGLAETQQTLVINNLRDRIRIQTDGQLRTGRDIAIAAFLGAEEFGFGTISLITLGCILMRKCHLNTCPVGIATQDAELRKRFQGKSEHLINFMKFIALDLREIMASLGFKSVAEMVGHAEVLEVNEAVDHWKKLGLDYSKILHRIDYKPEAMLSCTNPWQHDLSESLDYKILHNAGKALKEKKKTLISLPIRNRNRTVGAVLSSEISGLYGSAGLPEDTIHCTFTGIAGQSFGAFLAPGVTFELEGSANDYLGKGLSGGKIILYKPEGATFRSQNNIISGNVNLFGATRGEVYINGMAGERFGVRNSGALAVVEGLGDHGCEYMTGGVIVVLGKTGINFAAGMSGGIAFVLDEDQLFDTKCNLEMVDIEPVTAYGDEKLLRKLIKSHVQYTGSIHAKRILRDWVEMLPLFVKVMPIDYKIALERIELARESDSMAVTEEVFR
jgi:glutamate synthase (NADPH) large chain